MRYVEIFIHTHTHTHTSLPSVLFKASHFIVIIRCSAFFSVALDLGNQYLVDFFYKVQQFTWTVRPQRFTETPFLFHSSLTLTRAIGVLNFFVILFLNNVWLKLLLYTLKIVTIKIYCFSSIKVPMKLYDFVRMNMLCGSWSILNPLIPKWGLWAMIISWRQSPHEWD